MPKLDRTYWGSPAVKSLCIFVNNTEKNMELCASPWEKGLIMNVGWYKQGAS